MKTPLTTYANAGSRAGRAYCRRDTCLVSSLNDWRTRAIEDEAPADRVAAASVFWEAYKAEARVDIRFR